MSANNDLREVADLLESAVIGSIRLALAQSPHGPRPGQATTENIHAAVGVLDRHRHLQEASMAIALVHAIYQSEAAKLAMTDLPEPPASSSDSAKMADRITTIARSLMNNPAGTRLHQLGVDLASIAEDRP